MLFLKGSIRRMPQAIGPRSLRFWLKYHDFMQGFDYILDGLVRLISLGCLTSDLAFQRCLHRFTLENEYREKMKKERSRKC